MPSADAAVLSFVLCPPRFIVVFSAPDVFFFPRCTPDVLVRGGAGVAGGAGGREANDPFCVC